MAIPFYLFLGPEIGEKNEALLQLKQNFKKQFGDVEFNSFYAMESDVNEIMSQFSNGSLFSDAKFFVIKNAELITKKDDIQQIEDWAKAAKEQNHQCIKSMFPHVFPQNSLCTDVPWNVSHTLPPFIA